YWQEYIPGPPSAAIYVAADGEVLLLGLTHQLVGVPWLHAGPFQYCGSVGPLHPPTRLRDQLVALGNVLGRRGNLAGLFGIEIIPRGRPILTFFAKDANLGACIDALRETADALTRLLFPNLLPLDTARLRAADARILSNQQAFQAPGWDPSAQR